jgi:pimeloyl-ACP methyl ester carboxylesterase
VRTEHVLPSGDATARITSFSHDGLTFTVTDTGPVNGEPVVLLHGFPQRATCWEGVSEALHLRGYRTLALDQRGYSPGARPRTRSAYRLPNLVSDVAALVGHVGAPVHLVGHDWGAVVAWTLAARHPAMISSLVTVSAPHPKAFVRSLFGSGQALRSAYVVAFQLPGVPEGVARLAPTAWTAALRRTGMPPHALQRFSREMLEGGALGAALGWYRAIPLHFGRSRTGRLVVPTTHVWSDRDTALSRAGAEHSANLVDASFELVILPGVSHWVPDEVPETLGHVIDTRVRAATGEEPLSGGELGWCEPSTMDGRAPLA